MANRYWVSTESTTRRPRLRLVEELRYPHRVSDTPTIAANFANRLSLAFGERIAGASRRHRRAKVDRRDAWHVIRRSHVTGPSRESGALLCSARLRSASAANEEGARTA